MQKRFDSLGILLLVCASVPLLIGGYSSVSTAIFALRAEPAIATVTAIHSKKPWPGKAVHSYPILSFQDRAGNMQHVEMQSYTFPVSFDYGSTVDILFDPDDPTRIALPSWRAQWAQPLLGIVFGLMLLGAAFFLGRKSVVNSQSSPATS